MKLLTSLSILSFLFSLSLTVQGEEPRNNSKNLHGTWVQVVGYNQDGKETNAEIRRYSEHHLLINDTQLSSIMKIKGELKTAAGRFVVDTDKTPYTIDWWIGEATRPTLGIYEVNGDVLKIAWCVGKIKDRPTKLVPCPSESPHKWTFSIYNRNKP